MLFDKSGLRILLILFLQLIKVGLSPGKASLLPGATAAAYRTGGEDEQVDEESESGDEKNQLGGGRGNILVV